MITRIEKKFNRINSLLNSRIPPSNKVSSEALKLLLTESIRRSMIWKRILGEKAKFSYFCHILDDVACSVNNNWKYSLKNDKRINYSQTLDRRDSKIIDNYLNWELHSEELFNMYYQPNPYEPLICILEIGSGCVSDFRNYIEVSMVRQFLISNLIENLNLFEQQVVLDSSQLKKMS